MTSYLLSGPKKRVFSSFLGVKKDPFLGVGGPLGRWWCEILCFHGLYVSCFFFIKVFILFIVKKRPFRALFACSKSMREYDGEQVVEVTEDHGRDHHGHDGRGHGHDTFLKSKKPKKGSKVAKNHPFPSQMEGYLKIVKNTVLRCQKVSGPYDHLVRRGYGHGSHRGGYGSIHNILLKDNIKKWKYWGRYEDS